MTDETWREMVETFYEMEAVQQGYPTLDTYTFVCNSCQWKGNSCNPRKYGDIARGICPLVAEGKLPATKKAR